MGSTHVRVTSASQPVPALRRAEPSDQGADDSGRANPCHGARFIVFAVARLTGELLDNYRSCCEQAPAPT
jgi:hypothetical protein